MKKAWMIVALLVIAPIVVVTAQTRDRKPSSNASAPIMAAFPKGIILAWYPGPSNPVPTGWALCNGKNGTPDLQGKFMVGSEDFNDISLVGRSIGAAKHQHTFSATFSGQTTASTDDNNYKVFDDTSRTPQAKGIHHTHHVAGSVQGNTEDSSSIPPSVKIVYIIKM